MKEIYLPKLKRISIENFSFYQQCPTFTFNFEDGISAIIGANGIGKTTFINAIIYSLVGYIKEKRGKSREKIIYANANYFSNRVNKLADEDFNDKATVTLNFLLNNSLVTITRSMIHNKIISLTVNNEKIIDPDFNKYESIICTLSKIPKFEDFELIIREFLLFDESRKNVAWSEENQTRLLRILLFDNNFYEIYEKLQREITELDSKGRHASEDLRMAKIAFESLVKEKKDIDKKYNTSETNSEKLLLDKVTIINEIDTIKLTLNNNLSKIDNLIRSEEIASNENEKIKLRIENISESLEKCEDMLYSAYYRQLPDYYYDLEGSLIKNGNCLMCGAKSKELKLKHELKVKEKRCLICDSHLNIINTEEADHLISEVNNFNSERDLLINTRSNYEKKIERINKDIEILTRENNEIQNELNKLFNALKILEYNLSKNSVDSAKSDTYTNILSERQKKIDELTKIKEAFYRKRDEQQVYFNNYQKEYRKNLFNLNNSLSYYFNLYAQIFIGWRCELSISKKTKNKMDYYYYLPNFEDTIREDINDVSESQRFFLDQAFRMSIINYMQDNIKGFSTFFITETPEGSLDMIYEKQVANMFIRFANTGNNIIFTSNLNGSKFLRILFENIQHNNFKDRVLNLLFKSRLSDIQNDGLDELNELYNEYCEV